MGSSGVEKVAVRLDMAHSAEDATVAADRATAVAVVEGREVHSVEGMATAVEAGVVDATEAATAATETAAALLEQMVGRCPSRPRSLSPLSLS